MNEGVKEEEREKRQKNRLLMMMGGMLRGRRSLWEMLSACRGLAFYILQPEKEFPNNTGRARNSKVCVKHPVRCPPVVLIEI